MAKICGLAFLACCLVLSVQAKAVEKPKDPRVVSKFEVSPTNRIPQTITLPFEEPLFWTNDEFFSFPQHNCFTLKLSAAQPNVSIHVDFKFDTSDPRKRKLFRMDGSHVSKQFCLDQYIYLNRMKSFKLIVLATGDVKNQFDIVLEQHSGDVTFIQKPGKANLSGRWLFYNDHFDYSFEGPDDHSIFFACDQIANCFSFDPKHIDNGKVLYTLAENVRKTLLKTTPFIRISSDAIENAVDLKALDLKYDLHYNRATANSFVKIHSLYSKLILDKVLANPNAFSFTQRITPSQNRIRLTIPLDSIDMRIQEVVTQVKIISGNHSFVELVGMNKSHSAFNWPHARIQSDSEFTVSTRDVFAISGAELVGESFSGDKKNFFMDFVVYLDDGFDHVDVTVTIDVRQAEVLTRKGLPVIKDFPKHFPFPVKLWDNQDQFQWVGWTPVHNLSDPNDWVLQDKIQFNLTEQEIEAGTKINENNFHVKRVILGSRGEFFSITPLKLVFGVNGTQATYIEPILNGDLPQNEAFFRVGYLIQKGETVLTLNEMVGVKIHLPSDFKYFGEENCKHIPTFATLYCGEEPYTCPAHFKYNSEKGFCQLTN